MAAPSENAKNTDDQTVYVKGLPLSVTEDDIRFVLQGLEEGLMSVNISKKEGIKTAYAFVNFSSAAQALEAVKRLNETTLEGQTFKANLKSQKGKKVASAGGDAPKGEGSSPVKKNDASPVKKHGKQAAPAKRRAALIIDGSYCLAEFNRLNILNRVDWKRFLTFLETRLGVDFGTRKYWFDSVEGPTDIKYQLYKKLSLGVPAGAGVQTKGCGEHAYKYKTTRCCKQPNAACIHKKADGKPADINYKVQKGVDVSMASSILVHAHYPPTNPDYIDTIVLMSGDGDLRGSLYHARQVLHKTVFIIGVGASSVHTDIQQLASENIFLEEDGLVGQILTQPQQQPQPHPHNPQHPPSCKLCLPKKAQKQEVPEEPKQEVPQEELKKETPKKKAAVPEKTDQDHAVTALALIKDKVPILPFNAAEAAKSAAKICHSLWQGRACNIKCDKVHMWAPNTTHSVLKNSRQTGRICLPYLQFGSCSQYHCRLLHVSSSELHPESMSSALRAEGAPKIIPVACFAQCTSTCANASDSCPFVHIHWDQVQQRLREEFVKESDRIRTMITSFPGAVELTAANAKRICKQFWWESECSKMAAGGACPFVHAYIAGCPQAAGQEGKQVTGRICPFVESKQACPVGAPSCTFSHILPQYIRPHSVLDAALCPAQLLPPHKCSKTDKGCSFGFHVNWKTWSSLIEGQKKVEAQKEAAAAVAGPAVPLQVVEEEEEEIGFQPVVEDEEVEEYVGAGPSGSSSPVMSESPVMSAQTMQQPQPSFDDFEDLVAFLLPSAAASSSVAPAASIPSLDDLLMDYDDAPAFEQAIRDSLEDLGFDDSNPFSYYGSPAAP